MSSKKEYDEEKDYSEEIRALMESGADSSAVREALEKRTAKAEGTPGLEGYARDDVYNEAMGYIDRYETALPSLISQSGLSGYKRDRAAAALREEGERRLRELGREKPAVQRLYAGKRNEPRPKRKSRPRTWAEYIAARGLAGRRGAVPEPFGFRAAGERALAALEDERRQRLAAVSAGMREIASAYGLEPEDEENGSGGEDPLDAWYAAEKLRHAVSEAARKFGAAGQMISSLYADVQKRLTGRSRGGLFKREGRRPSLKPVPPYKNVRELCPGPPYVPVRKKEAYGERDSSFLSLAKRTKNRFFQSAFKAASAGTPRIPQGLSLKTALSPASGRTFLPVRPFQPKRRGPPGGTWFHPEEAA
jgi:hypothetical protein